MEKKRTRRKSKKREKRTRIDHIPTYSQQRRSAAAPKRRTDFSVFVSQGSLLEPSSSKEMSSSITMDSPDETKEVRTEILELPMAGCSESQDKRKLPVSEFVDAVTVEVESAANDALAETCSNRYHHEGRSETDRKLQFSPSKSQVTESSDVCRTPGSIQGEKNTCQQRVPDEDLQKKEPLDACKKVTGYPDRSNCSNAQDHLPGNVISPSSSRSDNDYMGKGRCKRKRKPKLHFDEVAPVKTKRKARRLKIMQFLGLAAPIGSPF